MPVVGQGEIQCCTQSIVKWPNGLQDMKLHSRLGLDLTAKDQRQKVIIKRETPYPEPKILNEVLKGLIHVLEKVKFCHCQRTEGFTIYLRKFVIFLIASTKFSDVLRANQLLSLHFDRLGLGAPDYGTNKDSGPMWKRQNGQ